MIISEKNIFFIIINFTLLKFYILKNLVLCNFLFNEIYYTTFASTSQITFLIINEIFRLFFSMHSFNTLKITFETKISKTSTTITEFCAFVIFCLNFFSSIYLIRDNYSQFVQIFNGSDFRKIV